MRTLWVALLLVPPIASASGTVVNDELTDPEPNAVKLLRTSRVRLHEIDDALYPLEVRPSSGEVFLQTGRSLWPFFLIAGAPALGLGLGLGYMKANVTSADPGVGRVLSGAALGLAVVAVALLVVCTFKMVDHWVEEAGGARAREARIRELKNERQALLTLQAH